MSETRGKRERDQRDRRGQREPPTRSETAPACRRAPGRAPSRPGCSPGPGRNSTAPPDRHRRVVRPAPARDELGVKQARCGRSPPKGEPQAQEDWNTAHGPCSRLRFVHVAFSQKDRVVLVARSRVTRRAHKPASTGSADGRTQDRQRHGRLRWPFHRVAQDPHPPASTTAPINGPMIQSGHTPPVHATSAPATITPRLADDVVGREDGSPFVSPPSRWRAISTRQATLAAKARAA